MFGSVIFGRKGRKKESKQASKQARWRNISSNDAMNTASAWSQLMLSLNEHLTNSAGISATSECPKYQDKAARNKLLDQEAGARSGNRDGGSRIDDRESRRRKKDGLSRATAEEEGRTDHEPRWTKKDRLIVGLGEGKRINRSRATMEEEGWTDRGPRRRKKDRPIAGHGGGSRMAIRRRDASLFSVSEIVHYKFHPILMLNLSSIEDYKVNVHSKCRLGNAHLMILILLSCHFPSHSISL